MRYTSNRTNYVFGLFLICISLSACATNKTFVGEQHRDWRTRVPLGEPSHRVYILGETASLSRNNPTLTGLRQRLNNESADATVVFTGSTTFAGLPDSAAVDRTIVEEHIRHVLGFKDDFDGRLVMLPGEGDWSNNKRGGLARLVELEEYVDDLFDKNVVRPDDAFPGPDVIKLTDNVRLVALNTQWWLNQSERPFGETDDYELQEPADFLIRVEEILDDYADETVLFVGHHPLVSKGQRGGHYPVRSHLFPLTDVVESAYIPLPIIGSLVPLYRRLVGRSQDLSGRNYSKFREAMVRLLPDHDRVIYAAGHEHNMQYEYVRDGDSGLHHIIAGATSATTSVMSGSANDFASPKTGYSVLSFYPDGSTWLEFIGSEEQSAAVSPVFRAQLLDELPQAPAEVVPTGPFPEYGDSVVVAAANPKYAAGPLRKFLLGDHYRDTWALPITIPVFDIGSAFGGLTPIKRGGGQQTVSLRLENASGRQYVLRSIDKRPENSIPEVFRSTIAKDILRDQTSAQHPYAAFTIPTLARAAGVYHTAPQLVYVPNDPRLGQYRDEFADQIMMLEDRPDDDMSDESRFGNSENVISWSSMYEDLLDDNDRVVDQRAFVRARLFDLLLSDWDRHRDQWRWAEFEHEDSTIFRPIPRDRDWAMNKWDGFFPVIVSYFDPKFRGFKEQYGNLKGLTKNGYEQDRRFLNALSKSDWIEIADSIRASLSDTVIEQAFRQLPDGVFEQDGQALVRLLKVRRDKLTDEAIRYYSIQAKIVDVVGSNKHEEFVVDRLETGETIVTVYKIRKDGERRRKLYERRFLPDETEEVRLYGLGGNDRFSVSGHSKRGIRVIVVGGNDDDLITDQSTVSGFRKMTRVYDTLDGADISGSSETRVLASDDPLVNLYDQRGSYAHDSRLPNAFMGFNRDDGVYLGGGFTSVRHGFRKSPFASSNKLVGNVAFKTGSYNAVYSGRFIDLVSNVDVVVDAHAYSPNSIRNYYGLGNETGNTLDDSRFYQARIQRYGGHALFGGTLTSRASMYVGPVFESVKVGRDSTRFIAPPQPGLSPTTYANQLFSGVQSTLSVATLDNALNPRQGIRWASSATYNVGLTRNTSDYTRLESDLALFLSPSFSPQVTTALRLGGRHTFGSFPFFDAATVGSSTNLRGFRSNRFAGRSSAYVNAELRLKLFDVSSILAVGHLGVLGFVDSGRVWTDGEQSNEWHYGYGGGIWFDFANVFVITATLGMSEEGNDERVGFGFQF